MASHKQIRVSYTGQPNGLIVTLIHTWKRGDIPAPVMSASSGPKDYVRNDIFALFDKQHDLDAVSMVVAGGPPFLILRKGQAYYDMSGKQVDVAARKEKP